MRMTTAAILIAVSVLAAIPANQAAAALKAKDNAELAGVFALLAAAENREAAARVEAVLADANMRDRDWQAFFEASFMPGWYTPAMTAFWEHIINRAGSAQPRTSAVAAWCAAYAVGKSIAWNGPDAAVFPDTTVFRALEWLQLVAPRLQADARAGVVQAISTTIGTGRVMVAPAPGANPAVARMLLQLYLVMGTYADESPRNIVSQALQLPEGCRYLWENHGVFLLDHGALPQAHVESLGMLLSLLPRQLHRVTAIIVPEVTGLEPALVPQGLPGQQVFIPATPLDRRTSSSLFDPSPSPDSVPEFIPAAGSEIIRAIQQEQFRLRPELAIKRDAILRRAGPHQLAFPRSDIARDTYLSHPEELLPAMGYLALIDSGAAFRRAMDLTALVESAPIDTFLLLVEMLSGGAESAPMYYTDAQGRMRMSQAVLERGGSNPRLRPLRGSPSQPVNQSYISAIRIDGFRWFLDIDAAGSVAQWFRR